MAVQGRNFVAAFGLGLTLCLMQQPLVAWAAMTMEETCALYPGDYIADPSDCQGWGYCKDNKLLATGKCADGLLYDSTKAICNYADQVECNVNITTMCTGLNAVYKADPDNCQNYCYCVNGVTECAKCPENQSFDPTISECVWNSKNENCVADSPCRLVPSNTFIADPNVCGGWLMCQNGIGKGGTCETGYNFNPSTGYCDPNYNLDCEVDEGGTQPEIDGICKAYTATDNSTQYVSDGQTCGGYVVCTSETEGTWQKCPLGTHFNPEAEVNGVTGDGACVTPYTYACPYDRCDNLNLTFVTWVGKPDNGKVTNFDLTCKKYITCSNQVTVATTKDEGLPCPSGYSYFDESIGGCVAEQPKQEICNNAPIEG